MAALWLHTTLLLVLLATSCPGSIGFPAEKMCGTELLYGLDYICENGFSFTPRGTEDNPVTRLQAQKQRRTLNVVEECCFKSCSLSDLQKYCC